MTTSTDYRPNLPDGHRLAARQHGDYWLAVDNRGYEYVVGSAVEPVHGGARIVHNLSRAGVATRYQIDAKGRSTPCVDVEEAVDAEVPAAHRAVRWGGVRRGPAGHAAEMACNEWARNLGTAAQTRWLWLHGPQGVGKSCIASLVVGDALRKGLTCRLVDWSELLRRIKATFGRPESDDLIESCIAVELLALDDVGKDQPSEWAAQILFEVVNGRERASKPTMATSNYTVRAACSRYGVDKGLAIADRIGTRSEVLLAGASARA